MKTITTFAFLLLAVSYASAAQTVTIDTVPVGNPGNEPDGLTATGSWNPFNLRFGAVNYNYRIGKTEVTNAQYVEFLNGVASADPYELYNENMGSSTDGGITRSSSPGGYSYAVKANSIGNGPGGADGNDYTYGDKPVNYASWFDSIRFANWLHNGQGSSDTETGSYTLLGGTPTPSNGNSITRNPGATWVLPSEDEWYKAAYHKNDGVTGNYWEFPTQSDTIPNNNLPSADTGNSANFRDDASDSYTTGVSSYPLTDGGAYTQSQSPYGTFDQGGNVREWNETIVATQLYSYYRGRLGSSWQIFGTSYNGSSPLATSSRNRGLPEDSSLDIGFRVARVPEPSSLLLGALTAVGVLVRRRR